MKVETVVLYINVFRVLDVRLLQTRQSTCKFSLFLFEGGECRSSYRVSPPRLQCDQMHAAIRQINPLQKMWRKQSIIGKGVSGYGSDN